MSSQRDRLCIGAGCVAAATLGRSEEHLRDSVFS